MESIGIWLVLLGLGLLGVLVAIWILWNVFGMALRAVTSGQDRKMRDSAEGRAVQSVIDGGGFNDGSLQAKARAAAAFLDCAERSPFALNANESELRAFARQFGDASVASSYPMMVDATYAVTGFVNEGDLADWNKSDDNTVVDLMALFNALQPGWMRGHRVGSLGQISIMRARMAMMVVMLLDKSELSQNYHWN